jgi:hypothetical protein
MSERDGVGGRRRSEFVVCFFASANPRAPLAIPARVMGGAPCGPGPLRAMSMDDGPARRARAPTRGGRRARARSQSRGRSQRGSPIGRRPRGSLGANATQRAPRARVKRDQLGPRSQMALLTMGPGRRRLAGRGRGRGVVEAVCPECVLLLSRGTPSKSSLVASLNTVLPRARTSTHCALFESGKGKRPGLRRGGGGRRAAGAEAASGGGGGGRCRRTRERRQNEGGHQHHAHTCVRTPDSAPLVSSHCTVFSIEPPSGGPRLCLRRARRPPDVVHHHHHHHP